MKVRITATPPVRELDGIQLDKLAPGTVRDVSPSIGSWLMAEGYAQLEMRQEASQDEFTQTRPGTGSHTADDRRQDRR